MPTIHHASLDSHRKVLDARADDLFSQIAQAYEPAIPDVRAMFTSAEAALAALSQGRVGQAMSMLDDAGTRRNIIFQTVTKSIDDETAWLYGGPTRPTVEKERALSEMRDIIPLLGAYQTALDSLSTHYRRITR